MMHVTANRADVPDESRWARGHVSVYCGTCRWVAILPTKTCTGAKHNRTHTAPRSEHHTSQQKIPTQYLQAWIPSLSTLVLCERGWVIGLNGNPRSQCACASGSASVRVRGRFGVCNRQITFPANLYQWASDDEVELKKVGSFSANCLSAKPNICAEVSVEFVVLFPTGLNTLSQSSFFLSLGGITAPLFFFKENK